METASINLYTDKLKHSAGDSNCHIIELNRLNISDFCVTSGPCLISSEMFKDIFYNASRYKNNEFNIPRFCNKPIALLEGTILLCELLNVNTWHDCVNCNDTFNLTTCATNLWKNDIIKHHSIDECIHPRDIYLGVKTIKMLNTFSNLKNLRCFIKSNKDSLLTWNEILELYDVHEDRRDGLKNIRQTSNHLYKGDCLAISIYVSNGHQYTVPIYVKLNFKII